MVVAHPVLLEIALVAAGGGEGHVSQGEDAQVAAGVPGVLHRHPPGGAVLLGADDRDVAAQIQHGGGPSRIPDGRLGLPGRKALGHGAQIHLHASTGQ